MRLDRPRRGGGADRGGGTARTRARWTPRGASTTIVCENMAAAARVHIVEKGRDPRRYAMVGFGGAGPAHAARVARILGVREVIVPPASGAAAALGFLVAPISFELVTSLPGVLDELDLGAVNRSSTISRCEGARCSPKPGWRRGRHRDPARRKCGCSDRCTTSRCRFPTSRSGRRLAAVKAAFAAEYERLYTHVYTGTVIQAISWRVLTAGPAPRSTSSVRTA